MGGSLSTVSSPLGVMVESDIAGMMAFVEGKVDVGKLSCGDDLEGW
jgi:hypothetical protein